MKHFQHSITIAASPATVYAALSTITGLRSWWTQDCDGATGVGDTIHLRFGACFKDMRVERTVAAQEVRWRCTRAHIEADLVTTQDEWVGTEPVFHLSDAGQDRTRLDFEHIGLDSSLECYGICLNGWQHFLGSLQQYLETGEGTPYLFVPPAQTAAIERSKAA